MLFFYTYKGDNMKIYLDLILILNFFFDFILVIAVGIILKRKLNIKFITLSSFIGSLSILLLFFDINSLELFILKLLISIIMIIVAYPKLDIRYIFNNLVVLYIVSLFLGGVLYMFNIEYSYKHTGLIFFNNGLSINLIVLIILSPIIIILYIKHQKSMKNKYNNYYSTDIYINGNIFKCTGYIDSGNTLTYKGNPVIFINKDKLKIDTNDYRIIPYKVVNKIMMLKIYKCDKVIINNHIFFNIYIGISEDSFNIDGIDVLLNNKLMEAI